MPNSYREDGVTLVELMITIAVIAVITAVAIPLYSGYLREGHLTAIRATINTMRTPIEDFRLDNGSYGTNTTLITTSATNAIGTRYGWDPGTDIGNYSYTVVVVSTNNYSVSGRAGGGSPWVLCENRLSDCCDSETTGVSTLPSACP